MLTFKERWTLSQPPKPLWTIRAVLAAALLFVLVVGLDYSRNWSAVEKFYLASYVRTWMSVWPEEASRYPLLEVVTVKARCGWRSSTKWNWTRAPKANQSTG